MTDFFISYTQVDCSWAEWIAWRLEDAGYTTVVQAWDFRPGGNFVLDMQGAAAKSECTIAVLSPAYLQSGFTAAEWAAAFATDPTGAQRRLLPVRIQECEPQGILLPIVYIDLVGLEEEVARDRLLEGVRRQRAKPTQEPGFPGPSLHRVTAPPLFPKVSQWRPITFDQSRDLGPALEGRGLGPSDAIACPRLVEAEVVVRQLRRTFSARLVGEPGSGKSASAYQAALTLGLQGWLVVRLGDPCVADVSLASSEDKPTLFLVDDAHLMKQDVLRDLEDQAGPTKLLLTVHTALDDTAAHRGAIPMDGARAVQTIATALKSNLRNTLAVINFSFR
jgi:hypothetical protein